MCGLYLAVPVVQSMNHLVGHLPYAKENFQATSTVSRHQILNLTGSTGFLYQIEVEN
jgi:hypothetical protein